MREKSCQSVYTQVYSMENRKGGVRDEMNAEQIPPIGRKAPHHAKDAQKPTKKGWGAMRSDLHIIDKRRPVFFRARRCSDSRLASVLEYRDEAVHIPIRVVERSRRDTDDIGFPFVCHDASILDVLHDVVQ
jgi:hypothetical protein